nr:spindle assembly abnormal protein 6 homolog isoform X2 [Parasteatoda tepidariorum]
MYQPSEEHIEQAKLDETDERLSEIHNNIHHIERRIRLADSEKKVDVEACNVEMKKNDLEIKQLMMQVKELEVKLIRSQKADENVIAKECRERSKELGNFKGKSAKRIRELENEQQKFNRDILECEVAQNKYKTMKEQLQTNQLSYPVLLLNVEREYESQQEDASLLDIRGIENPETLTSKGIGNGDFGMKETTHEDKKSIPFNIKIDQPETFAASEQEMELREMQESFDRIKEVTHASGIQASRNLFNLISFRTVCV